MNFCGRAAVPNPTRSFVASIESVLLVKFNPSVPPERATVVSFANVHAAAFAVTVSPDYLNCGTSI